MLKATPIKCCPYLSYTICDIMFDFEREGMLHRDNLAISLFVCMHTFETRKDCVYVLSPDKRRKA